MKTVAFIGSGLIAQHHAKKIDPIDNLKLVGVYDIDPQRAHRLARETGAKSFPNPATMLDTCRPDYVAVLTPRRVREEMIDLCIERQLPVFVEKPPCHDLSTGRRILEKLNAANLTHNIAFMHRWHDALNHTLDQIRSETLSLINICFTGPMATYPVIDTYPDAYLHHRGGGLVGDQGIHYIDISRYITQSEPLEIHAFGDHQTLAISDQVTSVDIATWTLKMHNGIIVNHAHTWSAKDWQSQLTLVTERSFVTVDFFNNRAWGTLDGTEYSYDGTLDEFEAEHRGFLKVLQTGDTSFVRSPYADALKSFEIAARINSILYDDSDELR